MNGWRSGWRDLASSDDLKDLEADLDAAEGRILTELASDPKTPLIARQVEAARSGIGGASDHARSGLSHAEAAARVAAMIDQTLALPRGGAAARVVGDQALFGVALTVDQAKALLDAWVDLMDANDAADSDPDGAPPSPEVVVISEFLFLLLDPLAEKLSELP